MGRQAAAVHRPVPRRARPAGVHRENGLQRLVRRLVTMHDDVTIPDPRIVAVSLASLLLM